MLRVIHTVLFGLLLLSGATCLGQQRSTTWLGGAGDWFDEGGWSNGLPTQSSTTHIPEGEVIIPGGNETPSVLALNLASLDQEFGLATLTVEDNNLAVTSRLTIANAENTTAVGMLQLFGDGDRTGNLIVNDLSVGFAAGEVGEADGIVEVTGNVIRSGKPEGSLQIGQNTSDGFASGKLIVGGHIGNPDFGFANVTIGHAAEGAGTTLAEVNAISLSTAEGQLNVGLNTSNARGSTAIGRLAVEKLRGFDSATFGFSERGSASASVNVQSFYEVGETVLGSLNGEGRARLTLGDSATLSGQSLLVHRGSSVSFGEQVNTEFVNFGRAQITNRPDGLPGGIVKMNNAVQQMPSGVLELDVVGLQRGEGYEAVEFADGGTLQGRLKLNFSPAFEPRAGDAFEFLRSDGPLNTEQLDLQLTNAPRNLAIEFASTNNVLVAKFVQPTAQAYANAAGTDFAWLDRSIWTNNQLPTSAEDIVMTNQRKTPQTVRTAAGSITRSLTIDGLNTAMRLHIPKGTGLSATHGIRVKSLGEIILDEGKIVTERLELDAEASFRGQGLIAGDIVNQGLLSVGLERRPSVLNIAGDFAQLPQGWMELDVLGTKDGQYDQVLVDGTLNLAGTLNLNLPDLDSIGPNAQIPLLQATGGITGNFKLQFDNRVGKIPLGLRSDFDPDSGDTTIMLISGPGPGILGDMNWDLSVDECDLDAFALSLQDVDTYTDFYVFEPSHIGDINDDGSYDVDDIRPFFDLVNGVGCASEALPEPCSSTTLVIGGILVLGIRHRRKETNGGC